MEGQVLELKYTLTEETYIEWLKYHFRHTQSIWNSMQRTRWILIFFTLVSAILSAADDLPFFAILWVIIGVAIFIGYPKFAVWRYVRNSVKMYQNAQRSSPFGEITIQITAEEIVETSLGVETRVTWPKIESIETTNGNCFVYTSPVTAIVISKSFVEEGNYDEFVNMVKEYFNRATIDAEKMGSQ